MLLQKYTDAFKIKFDYEKCLHWFWGSIPGEPILALMYLTLDVIVGKTLSLKCSIKRVLIHPVLPT